MQVGGILAVLDLEFGAHDVVESSIVGPARKYPSGREGDSQLRPRHVDHGVLDLERPKVGVDSPCLCLDHYPSQRVLDQSLLDLVLGWHYHWSAGSTRLAQNHQYLDQRCLSKLVKERSQAENRPRRCQSLDCLGLVGQN